jgi:hypothetical protein
MRAVSSVTALPPATGQTYARLGPQAGRPTSIGAESNVLRARVLIQLRDVSLKTQNLRSKIARPSAPGRLTGAPTSRWLCLRNSGSPIDFSAIEIRRRRGGLRCHIRSMAREFLGPFHRQYRWLLGGPGGLRRRRSQLGTRPAKLTARIDAADAAPGRGRRWRCGYGSTPCVRNVRSTTCRTFCTAGGIRGIRAGDRR